MDVPLAESSFDSMQKFILQELKCFVYFRMTRSFGRLLIFRTDCDPTRKVISAVSCASATRICVQFLQTILLNCIMTDGVCAFIECKYLFVSTRNTGAFSSHRTAFSSIICIVILEENFHTALIHAQPCLSWLLLLTIEYILWKHPVNCTKFVAIL